jgi:hypothetical protein
MATFTITNTIADFVQKAPGVFRSAAVRGAQQTAPHVQARMDATDGVEVDD